MYMYVCIVYKSNFIHSQYKNQFTSSKMTLLTIEKIQHFAAHNGFEIHKIFTKDSYCVLIELMMIHTVDFILLRIPHKYKFQIPSQVQTYPLVEVGNSDTLEDINEYTQIPESFIASSYSDMDAIIQLPQTNRNLSISDHLNTTYKQNVILDTMQSVDQAQVKEIHRQLSRLKYCIQGMSYDLAILHSTTLEVLNDQKQIAIYHCTSLPHTTPYKLYVVVSFKFFYDKIGIIEQECSAIFEGIYNILENNQKTHQTNINSLIQRQGNIASSVDQIQSSKTEFDQYTKQYLSLLDELYINKKDKEANLEQMMGQKQDHIHYEMKQAHRIQKAEKELQDMTKIQADLVNTICNLKGKRQTMILQVDTILFDNIVMLDKIFKNFEQISKIKDSIN